VTFKSHRLLLDLPITEKFYDHDLGIWPREWQQPCLFLNLYGELPSLGEDAEDFDTQRFREGTASGYTVTVLRTEKKIEEN